MDGNNNNMINGNNNNMINNPAQTTYFICRNNKSEVMAYGSVEPTQSMSTGQPIMEQYLDEQEWLDVLLEAGINPQQDEEL